MGKKPVLNSNDHISKIVDILGLEPYIPQQTTIKSDLTREKSARRSMGDIPGKTRIACVTALQQIISLASQSAPACCLGQPAAEMRFP